MNHLSRWLSGGEAPFSLWESWRDDCFAMTLKSRLDMLQDLRILDVFGLDEMEVHIGHDEEQAWIKDRGADIEESKSYVTMSVLTATSRVMVTLDPFFFLIP